MSIYMYMALTQKHHCMMNQLTMSIHHRGHIYVDVPVSCIALHLYTYMNNIIYCTQAPHQDINILQQFTQPWGYRQIISMETTSDTPELVHNINSLFNEHQPSIKLPFWILKFQSLSSVPAFNHRHLDNNKTPI